MPVGVSASQHRKMAEPGSAKNNPASRER